MLPLCGSNSRSNQCAPITLTPSKVLKILFCAFSVGILSRVLIPQLSSGNYLVKVEPSSLDVQTRCIFAETFPLKSVGYSSSWPSFFRMDGAAIAGELYWQIHEGVIKDNKEAREAAKQIVSCFFTYDLHTEEKNALKKFEEEACASQSTLSDVQAASAELAEFFDPSWST